MILSISVIVYVVFHIMSENKQASNVRLSYMWAKTTWNMNCTFDSFIFFWKNKVFRKEAMRILKTFKECLVGS